MSFYSGLASTASKLLGKYGTEIEISRRSTGSVDPITGIDSSTEQLYLTNGIYKKLPTNLIDGTRILVGDKLIVLDDTITPLTTDKIDGWGVEEIEEVKPADTTLVYFVRLRK